MNFNNYLFRAHSIGYIMGGIPKPLTDRQQSMYDDYTARKNGEGRALTPNQLAEWGSLHKQKNAKIKLSDSAKKYLEKLVWEELTGRSSTIKTKYFDKGIQSEEKSLTLYSNHKESLILKNKERKSNEFFTGEADIAKYKVRDIKSSWTWETFPLQSETIPNPMYEWQLDVYMDLWELKRSELIYTLVDTPFRLIEDELRRLDWQFNVLDMNGDVREEHIGLVVETISNHIYTSTGLENFCHQSTNIKLEWFENFIEIPEEIRVKIFKHNHCEKRNEQLKTMVILAREYMNQILEKLGDSIIKFNKQKLVS